MLTGALHVRKMKTLFEEITHQMDSTVKVVRINADNKPLMKDLAIDELPTLLIYKKEL